MRRVAISDLGAPGLDPPQNLPILPLQILTKTLTSTPCAMLIEYAPSVRRTIVATLTETLLFAAISLAAAYRASSLLLDLSPQIGQPTGNLWTIRQVAGGRINRVRLPFLA